MSVVIVACKSEFGLLIADTRLVYYNPTLNISYIASEEAKKIIRINDKVGIGFAGDMDAARIVLNNINKGNHNNFDDIIDSIHFHSSRVELGALMLQFFICGLNSNNKMELDVISSKNNFIVQKQIPDKGETVVNVMLPFTDDQFAEQFLQEHIYKYVDGFVTLDSLEKCFNNAIREVAKIDNTVNTNITVEKIFRVS